MVRFLMMIGQVMRFKEDAVKVFNECSFINFGVRSDQTSPAITHFFIWSSYLFSDAEHTWSEWQYCVGWNDPHSKAHYHLFYRTDLSWNRNRENHSSRPEQKREIASTDIV